MYKINTYHAVTSFCAPFLTCARGRPPYPAPLITPLLPYATLCYMYLRLHSPLKIEEPKMWTVGQQPKNSRRLPLSLHTHTLPRTNVSLILIACMGTCKHIQWAAHCGVMVIDWLMHSTGTPRT